MPTRSIGHSYKDTNTVKTLLHRRQDEPVTSQEQDIATTVAQSTQDTENNNPQATRKDIDYNGRIQVKIGYTVQ